MERWNHLQQRLDLISRWGLLKRAKIENAFVVCRCDAHICKLLTEQDFLITTTPAPLPLFPRSSIFDTGKQRFNLSVSVLGFFFLSFFLKKKKLKRRDNIGSVKLFWRRCTQEIVFIPVRGSQCLPSIPGGLFCHRLCAARHGRGRRQRVGQPSPTAVLLHPGTRRPPCQYENKFSSLFAINFPLQRRGSDGVVKKNCSRRHNI